MFLSGLTETRLYIYIIPLSLFSKAAADDTSALRDTHDVDDLL